MIRIRLKSADGQLAREKTVSEFPAIMGRSTACPICVPDGEVSSQHAEISCDGETLQLRDLGSRNGTFVNDERVLDVELPMPCTFRLGTSVTVEAEVVVTAATAPSPVRGLPRPDLAAVPAVFRPAPPPATTAYPVEAVVEVVPEAEVVLGEERYWVWLKNASGQKLALAMLGLFAFQFLCHLMVFRESAVESLAMAFGMLLGSVLSGAIIAAILALPGLLFRGEYDFKPLYIQQSFGIMLVAFEFTMRPTMLFETFGFAAKLLCLPLFLVVCFTGPYVFFFTTFPHKHGKRLLQISAVFSAIFFAGQAYTLFSRSRATLLHEAFIGEFHAGRSIAGSATDVKAITDELRAFGEKHQPKSR
ncbi:MAG: FHA domain-containing protein [Bdellovibrionota bacterium]